MSVVAGAKERFHFLDGLRGIASLMIVFHHSFTSSIVKVFNHFGLPYLGYEFSMFTQSGVELFFVLSGVVLLRPYLRGQRKFKAGNYLLRRIKRIYPPYLAALLFAACVSWYIYAYPTWYTAKVFHLYFDWPEIFKESVIINFDGGYYNLAWWSLGIEILFYLLVPIILLVFPSREKLTNRRMIAVTAMTFAVSLFLQLWLTRYYPHIYTYKRWFLNIFQAVCYPVCFLMGILLAAKDFAVKDTHFLFAAGILLIAISWFYSPIVNTGYGLVYAGIIILSFNRESFKHFLSRPIMIWIGERSYSLFLVHFSVFYLTDAIAARFYSYGSIGYILFSRGVGIPLALFVTMLLFTFVERWQARGLVTGKMFWPWQAGRIDRVIG